jgi:hypothetical protein
MSRSKRKLPNAAVVLAAIVGMGLPVVLFRSFSGAEFAIVVVGIVAGVKGYKAHRRAVRVAYLRNTRMVAYSSCSVASGATGKAQTAEQLPYWNAVPKRARA